MEKEIAFWDPFPPFPNDLDTSLGGRTFYCPLAGCVTCCSQQTVQAMTETSPMRRPTSVIAVSESGQGAGMCLQFGWVARPVWR